eukprot:Seg3040.2 transcript_id=Seg3040.2/GoldUCD/mRNA.D3Y31 product="Chitin-binding domain protein cbd-1" protein_id=Seg3040.2/GoldUCD/D3Y31
MNFTQCMLFLLAGVMSAVADPLCQYKPDGNYPLSDTLMYLKCTNQKGQMVNCPTNQVFIARERRCRTVTPGDQTTFCEGLADGDYRNPWSCSTFFKCVAGTVFTFSCRLSLVFDPMTDRCVYQSEFPCKVVTATSNGVGDILCNGKPDGQYPMRDTYKYVKCTNGMSQIMSCPANQVYIYREKRCRTVSLADQTTFCEGLPNDDYVWPWNCHKFIKCFAGITYVFNCQRADLIFNPYKDQCVYTGEYPCIVVKSTVESTRGVGDVLCQGKPDGKYPLRDTYVYLQCTNGNSQIIKCPANQVYIHREERCREVTLADQTTFCEGLPKDDYRWPWNCHQFVKCSDGTTYVFSCQNPGLNLVFDPYKDQCLYPGQYPCTIVKTAEKVLPAIAMVRTNRCTGKADGLYIVSDVFQYLECKAGSEIMHTCPDNTIFVAEKKNCSAVTTADEDRFCDSRPTGNYRNPWNCHHFISCVTGHPAPYDRPCHPLSLVYDPSNDRCEHKEICPCKQLSTPTPPKNRCTGKPDGNYILPDVFKYLECKSGQETLHFCPAKQIFAPDVNKCRAVTAADKVTFCNMRPEGNYRNPWNCHHFITCVTGHPSPYDRPCHPLTLVFDADNNQCEHDYLMTCVVV